MLLFWQACKFDYQHNTIEGRNEQIAAMDEVKNLVKEAEFSGKNNYW